MFALKYVAVALAAVSMVLADASPSEAGILFGRRTKIVVNNVGVSPVNTQVVVARGRRGRGRRVAFVQPVVTQRFVNLGLSRNAGFNGAAYGAVNTVDPCDHVPTVGFSRFNSFSSFGGY